MTAFGVHQAPKCIKKAPKGTNKDAKKTRKCTQTTSQSEPAIKH